MTARALSASQLRGHPPPSPLPPATQAAEDTGKMNGQERAQEAIAFGLGIDAEGYNIVVSGLSSSGRTTAVRRQVSDLAAARKAASDWCYFYNFENAYHPRAAALPAGSGVALQRDLARLIDACSNEIPKAFENETYQERSAKTLEPIGEKREALLAQMQRSAAAQGYLVNVTPMGFVAVPVGQDGRPLSQDVLSSLPGELRATIEQRGEVVEQAITAAVRELRKLDTQAREAIEALDQEVTRFVVGHHFDELRERYGQFGLNDHFDSIERDILQNIDSYKRFTQSVVQQLPAHLVAQATEERAALLRRYGVNVFVSQPVPPDGAPVIEERSPTYFNLFGRIDYQAHFGALTTDFTQIRPGSVHRANGGYLILQAEELLTDARAWLMLKRSLKTHEVRVEGIGDLMMPFPAVNVVPAAIPLTVKVILIGQPSIVAALEYLDPDFAELFKVRAEFEPDSDYNEATIASYAAFIRKMIAVHRLLPYSDDAIAEIVFYGARLAGRQDRLTTRYGALGDLCKEASHVAEIDGAAEVHAPHVLSAIDGKRRRSSLVPDRLRRLIAEGTLRIETSGSVVGQVNGLAVYQVGSYAFGTPVRISCRTGNGRRGVVAIEREVERSGAIHTKGVLVLSGYLNGTFGRDRVLAFTSSITFEQSYDEVEGDSASSAELYAILSSLASAPLRQDIAVTGSVDQFGRIQPVGGVTEKVEGFFDVCRAAGLTGEQGVMIPSTNVVNLTLRPDVVEAVAQGRFHLWSVSTVEEGLELLTGTPAGERSPDGTYPPETLFHRVTDALEEMGRAAVHDGEGRAPSA